MKNKTYMNSIVVPISHNEGAARQPAHTIILPATIASFLVEWNLVSLHNTPAIVLCVLQHEIPEVQYTFITMY